MTRLDFAASIAVAFTGLCLTTYGLFLAWPPLAPIFAGLVLIFAATGGPRPDPAPKKAPQ